MKWGHGWGAARTTGSGCAKATSCKAGELLKITLSGVSRGLENGTYSESYPDKSEDEEGMRLSSFPIIPLYWLKTDLQSPVFFR